MVMVISLYYIKLTSLTLLYMRIYTFNSLSNCFGYWTLNKYYYYYYYISVVDDYLLFFPTFSVLICTPAATLEEVCVDT